MLQCDSASVQAANRHAVSDPSVLFLRQQQTRLPISCWLCSDMLVERQRLQISSRAFLFFPYVARNTRVCRYRIQILGLFLIRRSFMQARLQNRPPSLQLLLPGWSRARSPRGGAKSVFQTVLVFMLRCAVPCRVIL